MSVLQSAAHGNIRPPALSRREHEKTIHCPLYTIHWHGSAGHQLAGRSYTYTAQRYMFSVHEDENGTRPYRVRERKRLCHHGSKTRAGAQGSQASRKQNPSRRSGNPGSNGGLQLAPACPGVGFEDGRSWRMKPGETCLTVSSG